MKTSFIDWNSKIRFGLVERIYRKHKINQKLERIYQNNGMSSIEIWIWRIGKSNFYINENFGKEKKVR